MNSRKNIEATLCHICHLQQLNPSKLEIIMYETTLRKKERRKVWKLRKNKKE